MLTHDLLPIDLRDVTEIRDIGIVVRQHRRRERVYLAEADWFPPKRLRSDARGLYAAEQADVAQWPVLIQLFSPMIYLGIGRLSSIHCSALRLR